MLFDNNYAKHHYFWKLFKLYCSDFEKNNMNRMGIDCLTISPLLTLCYWLWLHYFLKKDLSLIITVRSQLVECQIFGMQFCNSEHLASILIRAKSTETPCIYLFAFTQRSFWKSSWSIRRRWSIRHPGLYPLVKASRCSSSSWSISINDFLDSSTMRVHTNHWTCATAV